MTKETPPDRWHNLRPAGPVIGIIGMACALVSAGTSFTLEHYPRGLSTLGAGLVFGTIFVSQYFFLRHKKSR